MSAITYIDKAFQDFDLRAVFFEEDKKLCAKGRLHKLSIGQTHLRSVAADPSKNLNLPESARGSGGGVQFFTNNNGAFRPLGGK